MPFSLEFTISSYFSTCLIHHTHVLVTSFPHVYHPDSLPEPGALYTSPTPSTAVHIASGMASGPAPKPHLITCVLVPLRILSQVGFSGCGNQHMCNGGAVAGRA